MNPKGLQSLKHASGFLSFYTTAVRTSI